MNRAIVIVKAGEPEFADAMANGIMAARSRQTAQPSETVQRSLLRVAVGNNKTADDYAVMRCDAEIQYGEPLDEDGPLRRAARKVLGVYGLLLVGIANAYRAQDRVLGGGRGCRF